MTYKINIKKKAQKFINKQDKQQQLRLYKAIYNLPADVLDANNRGDIYKSY